MIRSSGWESKILYAFLIGKISRDGTPIAMHRVKTVLYDLFETLKREIGGITRMRPFEATGETSLWGNEPTTVVLVLADLNHEEKVDTHIADQGLAVAQALTQDQVWITKQDVNLYIAHHPS